jgi:glycerate-2-kinase
MCVENDARLIFLNTLEAINPLHAIREKVRVRQDLMMVEEQEIDLASYKEILLIGLGKASLTMGAAMEGLLGARISRGLLVCDRPQNVPVKSEVIIAGHPTPDSESLRAGEKILSMVRYCAQDSLIIFLVSGGGSALVESLASASISLLDLKEMNRALVTCGASIAEINIIRKRISRIKGGRLGYLARDVPSAAFYLSDVNPGDLRSLASNPLLPETPDSEALRAVIDKYRLGERLPETVLDVLHRAPSDEKTSWSGKRICDLLLMDNLEALKVAAKISEEAGYIVEIDTSHVEGYYRDVADALIDRLMALQERFSSRPVCLISGGEVSCPVAGKGLGGRNQEFVLYCAARLEERDSPTRTAVLSSGTDGIDGNSDAAGSVASPETIRASRDQGIDIAGYFQNSDSHSFFRRMGGLICTGPTGNNVRDIRILISRPE